MSGNTTPAAARHRSRRTGWRVRCAARNRASAPLRGGDPRRELHHYHFRLLALDVKHLALAEDASFDAFEKAPEGHVPTQAERIGVYSS